MVVSIKYLFLINIQRRDVFELSYCSSWFATRSVELKCKSHADRSITLVRSAWCGFFFAKIAYEVRRRKWKWKPKKGLWSWLQTNSCQCNNNGVLCKKILTLTGLLTSTIPTVLPYFIAVELSLYFQSSSVLPFCCEPTLLRFIHHDCDLCQ